MHMCAPLAVLAVFLPLLVHKGGLHVHLEDAANSQILPGELSSILDATKKKAVAWPRHCMAMPEGVAQVSLDQRLCDWLCCSA